MNKLPIYIKTHFKLEDYLDVNTKKYDYSRIVNDFWKTGLFPSAKLDLVPAIMTFGKGNLLQTLVIDTIEKELTNIKGSNI